jgi:ribosomal protein L18
MDKAKEKRLARMRRHARVRRHVRGTPDRPRLCVFRSSKHIHTQIIDDVQGNTLVAASTLDAEVQGSKGWSLIGAAINITAGSKVWPTLLVRPAWTFRF